MFDYDIGETLTEMYNFIDREHASTGKTHAGRSLFADYLTQVRAKTGGSVPLARISE